MRVTIGQINTTNGDYEGNTASIYRAIEHARKDKSDLSAGFTRNVHPGLHVV